MTDPGRYGLLDRLIHRFVFRSGTTREVFSDLENVLYRRTFDSFAEPDPLFITGLPRSGTTILLRCLCDSGHFASHTYRDMPFVLSPLLWGRFSRRFRTTEAPRERSHGDGILISADSPEAFEEMVWKHFWPGHYLDDRILVWTAADRADDFDAFFTTHMKKVVAARQEEGGRALRYVSKNNLNIARLGAIPSSLSCGLFLVPFRDPLQHAASMRAQHLRFTKIQRRDRFVREYMEAIGHHEFGLGLRPVNFGGWLDHAAAPETLEFWLQYWIAAYRHVLEKTNASVQILSYAGLVSDPPAALKRLAEVIRIDQEELRGGGTKLKPPRYHPVNRHELPGELVDQAEAIHSALRDADIFRELNRPAP